MVIVYNAKDIIEAQLIAGLLESKGIETHVGGTYLQGGIGELAAMDFATVSVDEKDVARSRSIIDEYEAGNPGRTHSKGTRSMTAVFVLIAVTVLVILVTAILYG
jgi:hypothetical protein